MSANSAPVAISRRRVIQASAWATPAVLIATAVPAIAASPPVLGRIAITGSSGAMNTANFFVTATVAYLGDPAPHADYPVSGITLTVALPTNRVVAGAAGVTALNWSYVGRVDSGGTSIYTFAWNGLDLSATNPATSQVTVRIPATASLAPVSATLTSNGTSNGTAVIPATATVPFVVGADLVVDDPTIEFVNWMPAPGGGQQNGCVIRGKGRWAGPYSPEGATVTDLRLVIRIPDAYTDGSYTVLNLGAGWSLTQAPTLSNGVWQATWGYAKPLTSASRDTTPWEIAFKARGAKQLNAVTNALYGLAGGSPNYYPWSGPKQ